MARLALAAMMALTVLLPTTVVPANAAGGDRTLWFKSTHRDDSIRVTFKRNGKYDKEGLKQLNYFLRDWRTNDVIEFDPLLFDLIWEVYQEVGATQPVNVVSSYRSPKTNAALAKKSSGVADNSQHMKGKAIDFFIPGVDLATLRATAMKKQFGGVGYYPTSGSPFVHLDTGSVRAWPRMTKAQLQKVFPDGKTLHLPTDGTPLSKSGYALAQTEWQSCHRVPCNGASTVMVASLEQDAPTPTDKPRTLMDMFFGNDTEVSTVVDTGPTERQVETVAVMAPLPMDRPAGLTDTVLTASLDPDSLPFSTTGSAPLDPAEMALDPSVPYPAIKSEALMVATRAPLLGEEQTAVAAIDMLDSPSPVARTLMTPVDDLVTAYAADLPQDPSAQRALEMIIERETVASIDPQENLPELDGGASLRTASLGNSVGIDGFADLFDATFSAVSAAGVKQPVTEAVTELALAQPLKSMEMRPVALVMPDMEHAELFAYPVPMHGNAYAVIFDRDEADFSPATELGSYITRVGFELDPEAGLASDRFELDAPLLIAAQ